MAARISLRAGWLFSLAVASPVFGQSVDPVLDAFYKDVASRVAPYAFAVVVVRGESVVHLGGYGSRDGIDEHRVTGDTPFYIASSTKSFTALTAALLARRGVVDLDAPITRYAPEFSLPAPLEASRITLRRLLSHRGGFESGELAFRTAYTGDVPPDSLFPLLARTASPVDSAFTYTNTAFIIAARTLERVTHVPWQELVKREVLAPLGLSRTSARPSASLMAAGAFGIGPGPDGPQRVAFKSDATMHAAGGMLMSAADAGRWLIAQLNDGRGGSRQVLPRGVVAGTHKALAVQDTDFDGVHRTGYALGWQVGQLNGETLYHHFGNYPGAFAHISFMPDRRVAVAVFSNSEMPALGRTTLVLAQRAYDRMLGQHERDPMYATYGDTLAAGVARMYGIFRADYQRRAARPRKPPRGWAAYAGVYAGPNMGWLMIEATSDTSAELTWGTAVVKLEVLSGDTLRVGIPSGRGGAPAPVTFGPDGRVATIQVAGVTFARQPNNRE